jgi:hemerythrin-like metal-binding protein
MNEAMKEGEAADRIRGLISELLDYTVYHFSQEEKLMEQNGYAGLAEQKLAHQAFIDKVKEYKDEAAGDMAIFVVSKVSTAGMEWLIDHIMVMDKKYEDTLKGL